MGIDTEGPLSRAEFNMTQPPVLTVSYEIFDEIFEFVGKNVIPSFSILMF